MYYHDLKQEINYLKSRLSYKLKRLDEAELAKEGNAMTQRIKEQIREIEEKLQVCKEELRSQEETENKEWREGLD